MAEESLVVSAQIRNQLSGGLRTIRTDLASLRAEVAANSTQLAETSTKLDKYGAGLNKTRTSTEGLTTVSRGLRDAGLGLVVGFALAAKTIATFESAMSELKVASGATTSELQDLRGAAIEAGKSGIFTETQAAQGMTALAKAGVSVTDILNGGLTGALDLAAAGGQSLEDAAESTASALAQFQLRGSQASHVADVLAAGAGKAQGSVADMSEALRYTGLTAHQLGVPIEQTVGVLALFANNALQGSQGGTTLQETLLHMNPVVGESRDLVQKLGISAYDQQGRFIGLANYAQLLHDKLSGMSQEQRTATLTQIFGQRAIQGATILYQAGAKGVDQWTKAVNDTGYASDYANGRLDNLNGDFLKLRGTLQALVTGSGSSTNTMLRTMAQHLTNDIDLFAKLPQGVQSTGLAFAGAAGAGLALLGTLGTILPKFDALQSSFGKMAQSEGAAGTAGKILGAATGVAKTGFLAMIPILGIAAAALDYYGQKAAQRKADVQSLTDAIQADGDAIGRSTISTVAKGLADQGAFKAAQKLGLSQSVVTQAALGNAQAMNEVHSATQKVKDAYAEADASGSGVLAPGEEDLSKAMYTVNDAVNDQSSKFKAAQKDAQDLALAADATSTVNQKVAAATGISTSAIYQQSLAEQDATDSATALKNILDGLNNTNLTVAQNQVSFRQSLLTIKSTIDDNTKSATAHAKALDLDTQAGLQNNANINAAVQQAMELAEAVTNQTGSVAKGEAAWNTYRGQIEKMAVNAGLSRTAVDKLLDQIAETINLKPTVPVNADTSVAQKKINDLKGSAAKPAHVPVTADTGAAQAAINTFLSHVGELKPVIDLQGVVTLITKPGPIGSTSNPNINQSVPFKNLGGKAFGGPVEGPGSSRSDSIGYLSLSRREWVIPADVRDYYGDAMLSDLTNRSLPKFPGPDESTPAPSQAYAGGITLQPGAVQFTVANASPAELERADLPGRLAEALLQARRDAEERGAMPRRR